MLSRHKSQLNGLGLVAGAHARFEFPPMPQPDAKRRYPPQPIGEPVVVTVSWLVKNIAAVIVAAGIGVYLTMCLLFYQGQWQLVFHPSHVVDRTPASIGLQYEEIRFNATETGHLQLAGWWVPADPGGKYEHETMLLCHDNIGSVSNTLGLVSQLHSLGINVFVFDYHGFGNSDWEKPSERLIYRDTNAAVEYLVDTRHIAAAQLALYGEGMGATACAQASVSTRVAAVILENPVASMLPVALNETQTRFVPTRFLFRQRLELYPWLQAPTPKLFIKLLVPSLEAVVAKRPAMNYSGDVHSLFVSAADPKMYWEELLPGANNATRFPAILSRFLDEYLPAN